MPNVMKTLQTPPKPWDGGTVRAGSARVLDADRDLAGFKQGYPGGGSYIGYAYNVGYARAMLQAALESWRSAQGV
jgi:hypothetical protein